MTASTFQREDLMPKSADGTSRGMLFAVLVHVGLLIALTLGVHWKMSEPEGVEAELWASVPQIAAQKAVEPPQPQPKPTPTPPKPEPKPEPTPKVQAPDPQIAIEKARQEKLKKQKEEEKREREEKDKLDKKKADEKKAEADKRKKEEERLAAIREANIKKILGDASATGDTHGGKAKVTAGPSASWAGRVVARVRPNFVYTDAISGDPAVEVELKLGPDGTIIGRKLVKGSGDSRLDEAVLRAIDKTETLPRDTDGSVPPSGVIVFRPGKF